MSWKRAKNKPDANQEAVVAELRKAGLKVWLISQPCDLLVWNERLDRLFLLEVKNPEWRNKNGTIMSPKTHLRPSQRELIDLGVGDFAMVWSAEEALEFCDGR